MMAADYSIANGFTPTSMIATVPSSVMRPTATPSQQVVVIPRSTTETLGGISSFPPQTVDNFASLAGGNPLPKQFALAPMAPTSATTLADGIPLYTDSTILNALNTGGLPLANTSSLFASSIQPQETNLSTLGGLDGNITAVPSLAYPRSLGAIPTATNTTPVGAGSTPGIFQLLAGLSGSKNSASGVDENNPNAVSSKELLANIRDLKATIIAKKDRDNEEMKSSEKTINRADVELNDKTLVSASPRSAAAEG